jgi:hypothetical protein
MQVPPHSTSARFLGLTYLCAVAIGVLVMMLARAYQAGFSGADEPSHFLNGYFIANYLTHHFGSNPMGAASEFYIHYPKISIGHWPPAYYGFLGILFTVLPPTMPVVFAINVLCAALPALGVVAALAMLDGRRAAVAGMLVYGLSPLVLEGDAMFMVDQPLAGCLVAATAVWIAYVRQPGWGKALGFALLAALAVLIKGNGWLVVFVPLFHIVLTARWKLLLSFRLYAAAALMALIVVPWYVLTAKIAADGFNYQAGIDYASMALGANLRTLMENVTPVGMALAAYAVVAEFRERRHAMLRWTIVSGAISLLLATLVFQSLVPVDIVPRYMAPALPVLVMLAVLGGQRLLARLGSRTPPRLQVVSAAALVLVMALPGVLHLVQRVPKADTGIEQVANRLSSEVQPQLTVIDGPAGAEGAFIADMAVRDRDLKGYVIRSSRLLADSNFMGSSYSLKFSEPGQVLDELHRLGIRHVVIVRENDRAAYAHSTQIRDAMAGAGSGFHLAQRLAHRYRPGTTEVYDADTVVQPDIAAVRSFGVPSKVAALSKLQ